MMGDGGTAWEMGERTEVRIWVGVMEYRKHEGYLIKFGGSQLFQRVNSHWGGYSSKERSILQNMWRIQGQKYSK